MESRLPVPVPEEEKESLDFSDFQFSETPADFQIEADIDPVVADIEQAAVLYANGQDGAACKVLEGAVRLYCTGMGERLWLMLFDLYRLTGQKTEFEALEINYANVFEKSPPAWRDASHAFEAVNMPETGGVLFQGPLLGENNAGFMAVSNALTNNPKLRLDLSKVTHFDAAGCARLLAQLQQARKVKREIQLFGHDNVSAQLEACIASGQGENSECWLLLFELYQFNGQQEAFEELAINYAVTFEVSPPSWDAKRVAFSGSVEGMTNLQNNIDQSEGYILHDDVKGCRFSDLHAYVDLNDPVLIDCAFATRIDFVSAGNLLNLLRAVAASGKKIILRYPNRLVAELFNVVGLSTVAQIIFDKH